MEIQFRYSVDDEVARVQNTLEKILWYREQGYRPIVPEGISDRSSDEEIRRIVAAMYEESDYEKVAEEIRNDVSVNIVRYFEVLGKYSSGAPDNLIIKLTRYGTSGSYQLPNFIVYNIDDARGIKTIYHEIAHLVFELEFIQHTVSHWQRERIIDLLLHTGDFAFLAYEIWQPDYHGVENVIDPSFEEYFRSHRSAFYARICGPR